MASSNGGKQPNIKGIYWRISSFEATCAGVLESIESALRLEGLLEQSEIYDTSLAPVEPKDIENAVTAIKSESIIKLVSILFDETARGSKEIVPTKDPAVKRYRNEVLLPAAEAAVVGTSFESITDLRDLRHGILAHEAGKDLGLQETNQEATLRSAESYLKHVSLNDLGTIAAAIEDALQHNSVVAAFGPPVSMTNLAATLPTEMQSGPAASL